MTDTEKLEQNLRGRFTDQRIVGPVIVLGTLIFGYGLGIRSRPAHPGHLDQAFGDSTAQAAQVSPVLQPTATALPGLMSPANNLMAQPNNMSNVFVGISQKTVPSVVNIFTTKTMRAPRFRMQGGPDNPGQRFFEDFFGGGMGSESGTFGGTFGGGGGGGGGGGFGEQQAPAQRAMSLGSGFIVEALPSGDAYIMTNNHVIDGADEVKVKFTEAEEEKETEAKVVGTDADLDVALLRVHVKKPLQAVALGDSDKLEVGEWIAAVGNPFGHGHSVSHGIVSAKERSLPGGFGKYLQTDAPINPGNSGGPLVNLKGEVVGINNAIDGRGNGIGFAIPVNSAKAVLAQLKQGKIERGMIGISVDELRPELAKHLQLDESIHGPIVTQVIPSQPAFKAGLRQYDVITEVNSKVVHSGAELVEAIRSLPVGSQAHLKILRSGKEMTFNVAVAPRSSVTS